MTLVLDQQKASLYQAIEQMSRGSVELLAPVILELLQHTGADAVFVTRAIRAILQLAEGKHLEISAAAASDFDVLLSLLQRAEVQAILPSPDPLAQAKLRGVQAQQQLLQMAGGCISAPAAAERLGISRQAVDKRRTQGKLIALLTGRTYHYPVWQFEQGNTLSGLEQVLKVLGVQDPWMQTAWFLNGNSRLEGHAPLQVLRQGELARVLDAAQSYGEQGAA